MDWMIFILLTAAFALSRLFINGLDHLMEK